MDVPSYEMSTDQPGGEGILCSVAVHERRNGLRRPEKSLRRRRDSGAVVSQLHHYTASARIQQAEGCFLRCLDPVEYPGIFGSEEHPVGGATDGRRGTAPLIEPPPSGFEEAAGTVVGLLLLLPADFQ